LRALLSRFPNRKAQLRSIHSKLRGWYANACHSYGEAELRAAFGQLGIRHGNTVLVHSGFNRFSGYRGTPSAFIETLLTTIGPKGNLLMVSMAYMSSAYAYLKRGSVFDVRKTVSHMGVISEAFRHYPGVVRSLHPSNPVLARGARAGWIVEGHERCLQPCGPGSPFEKFAALDGKVLFYDASMYALTFFHYLEDLMEDRLDFPLFREGLMEAKIVDYDGKPRTIRTRVYSEQAIRRRDATPMFDELDKAGLIRRVRVGNSQLILLHANDLINEVRSLAARGISLYKRADP